MIDARSNTPVIMAVSGPKKVSKKLTFRRPFFIVSLAILFLFNSLGGDLLIGEAWAARVSSGLTSVGPENSGSPTPLKSLNPETFTLPQELGYIQESTKVPGSTRTIIHIQDAHCNYAAQKSISEILGYLTKEYGIYAVNCEGGAEGYDLTPFTSIPEKDIRQKVSDYFVKEGVVSAAEFFAVNNPEEVKLWGVEDADLYIRNLKIYRDSFVYKPEADRYLKSIGYILDNLKNHIYSQELLELDTYYTKYKAEKIGFKEYITYLMTLAGKKMIDIKAYPNLYLLNQTLGEEEKIDFRKANNEKDEVVDKLKKTLSRNELEELMTKVGELKSERISHADFYAYLVKKAKSIRLDLAAYPELQKYIVYVSIYGAIDRTKITKELDKLEDKIKESLYENDTQRELGILSKNLTLERNIFNISLTRDDYTYYQEHRASFGVSNFVKFIDAKAPLYKIRSTLDKNIGMLDEYRERMDGFYECSLERDKAFIKNIKFTDHDRPNSIIITGGFHTQSLRELFNKEKVSYISIMPKFKNEKGYESPYLKRLAGQRTALENVIDTAIPAVLNLQVVEMLTRLGIIVEGEQNFKKFELAILIVTAVKRGQDFILKIPSRFIPSPKKEELDKIVTFPKGEGAEAVPQEPTEKFISPSTPAAFNAEITVLSRTAFDYRLSPSQMQTAQPPQLPVFETPKGRLFGPQTEEEFTQGPVNDTQVEDLVNQIESVSGSLALPANNEEIVLSSFKEPVMMKGIDNNSIKNMFEVGVTKKDEKEIPFIQINYAAIRNRFGDNINVNMIVKAIVLHELADVIGKQANYNNNTRHTASLELEGLFAARMPEVRNTLVELWKIRPVAYGAGDVAGSAIETYEAARKFISQIAELLRKGSPTYDINAVASEEDISNNASNNRRAEQILGKQGQNIHAKSYLAKGDWIKNLKEILDNTIDSFSNDAVTDVRTRMIIRVLYDEKDEKKEDRIGEIGTYIKELLDNKFFEKSKTYSKDEKDEIDAKIAKIISKINYVPIYIKQAEHLNPVIDLLVDIDMMECDRYRMGHYEGEIPPQLKNNFLAMLKLSITNFEDLVKAANGREDAIDILKVIFGGNMPLKIRAINWKSIDEYRKSQELLLQAV